MKTIVLLLTFLTPLYGADLLIFWWHPWDDEDQAKWSQEKLDEYNKTMYKRGDVIKIYPDNTFTEKHPSPRFAVVKIPGLSVEAARKYVAREEEDVLINGVTEKERSKRRAFFIDIASMTTQKQTTLSTDKIMTENWSTIRSNVKEKKTGKTEALVLG